MKKAKQPRKTSKASKRKTPFIKKIQGVSNLLEAISREHNEEYELTESHRIKQLEDRNRHFVFSHVEIRRLQKGQEIGVDKDFGRGFFNGMELCLSVMEKRQPNYLTQDNATILTIDQKASEAKTPIQQGNDFESAFVKEHWAIKMRKKYTIPNSPESNETVKALTEELIRMFPAEAHIGHIDVDVMNSEQIVDFFLSFLINKEFAYATILEEFNNRILNKLANDSAQNREKAEISTKRFEEALGYLHKLKTPKS